MTVRIPERNRKAGVCYAVTDDGIELPVIDITHPAFSCEVSAAELSAIIDASLGAVEGAARMPDSVRRSLAASSILARGWLEASGTFMTGMMTYLNRLGPDNLGEGYAGRVDRWMAATVAPLSFRFRLRDVARLAADGLAPALRARKDGPLHLLNIGGGPAADSLNALILLRGEHPEWLRGRRISIHVLDLDAEGPHFGARALAALAAEGAPLAGATATLRHVEYNWADPSGLRQAIAEIEPGAVVAGSSEGGLFDYGTDGEIVANLGVLRDGTPDDFVMTGSVVRDENSMDPRLRATTRAAGMPAIRYLGLEAFSRLAGKAGWVVDRVIDSLAHHAVSLKKA